MERGYPTQVPSDDAASFIVRALVRMGAIDGPRFRQALLDEMKEHVLTYPMADEVVDTLQEFAVSVGYAGTMSGEELAAAQPERPGAWAREAKAERERMQKEKEEALKPAGEEKEEPVKEAKPPQDSRKPPIKVKPRK